jgi:hypothetical protein
MSGEWRVTARQAAVGGFKKCQQKGQTKVKIKIEIDAITRYDFGTLIVEAPDISHVRHVPEDDLAELVPEENRQSCAYDADITFEVMTIQVLDIMTEEQYRAYEEAEKKRLLDAIPTAQLVLPCCSEK